MILVTDEWLTMNKPNLKYGQLKQKLLGLGVEI